jgi:hypothetical protein
MRTKAWTGAAGAVVVAMIALAASHTANAMTTAQQRLLCVQLSGDLTDPGGLAEFQRCMRSNHPIAAMQRNVLPPRRPIPGLVTSRPVTLVAQPRSALPGSALGGGLCPQGYVWREATPTDHVCVTPAARAEVRAGRTGR